MCIELIHVQISTFVKKLQTIIQHSLIIIMGDFNVDILKDNNHWKKTRNIRFDG
jgi:hypothetical protein